MKCLIASGNQHKVDEIRRIFRDLPLELVDLSSFPPISEPIEDGKTFLENALLKSRYYCQATGLMALADDSGLEVDALNGEPGIYSARYAGADSPHSAKMAKVLELLKDVPLAERGGRFKCVVAITYPDGRELHSEGTMEGSINFAPSGAGGFGYDPIVYLPELDKTVAELSDSEKDSLSHRGSALRKMAKKLF